MPERRRVRVMTWNIHGGLGLDGHRDLDRIVAIAQRHDPDIVALQEVGSRKQIPGAAEAFAVLSSALGNHFTESRMVTAPDGDYGHVVISRWPLSEIRVHDISYRKREPRAAIEVLVHTPFGPLHVVSAHFGLSFAERRHQTERLVRIVRGPHRTVLLGDFNHWHWGGSVQKTLDKLFPGHSHFRTFPSFFPLFALDRVYCRPSEMLLESWTEERGWAASDHLPVIAELAMG